jgi:lysophospholipase L1-like esterase
MSPHEVPLARTDGRYRLLILGDSATVGMGLQSIAQSWPQVLERLTNGAVEVVNAATVCYSSEQTRRYLVDQGAAWAPDGLAVYIGSADGIPSSMTDEALLQRITAPPTGPVDALNRWLVDESSLYVALRSGLLWGLAAAQGQDITASQGRIARVPPPRYRENLMAMISWADARGMDVYLITPPTPLEYPPGIHDYNFRYRYQPGWRGRDACLDAGERPADVLPAVVGTDESRHRYPALDFIGQYAKPVLGCFAGREAEQRARFEAEAAAGVASPVVDNNLGFLRFVAGDWDAALDRFLRAVAAAPDVAAYHYNAGMTLRQLGRDADAVTHLQRAVDLDGSGSKIQSPYLAEMRTVGTTTPHVTLVDASAVFREGDNEHLFSDHVHPNVQGQELVANLVRRAVEPHLGRGAVARAP